jgi:hypothetical protein
MSTPKYASVLGYIGYRLAFSPNGGPDPDHRCLRPAISWDKSNFDLISNAATDATEICSCIAYDRYICIDY